MCLKKVVYIPGILKNFCGTFEIEMNLEMYMMLANIVVFNLHLLRTLFFGPQKMSTSSTFKPVELG